MLSFECGQTYRLVKTMSLQPMASGQLRLSQKLSKNEEDDIRSEDECTFIESNDDGFHFCSSDGRKFVVDSSIVRLCFIYSIDNTALLTAQKELDCAIEELIELIDYEEYLNDVQYELNEKSEV